MTDREEAQLRREFAELQKTVSDANVYQQKDYPQLAKRFKELTSVIALLDKKQLLIKQRRQTQALAEDKDQTLATLAKTEIEQIEEELADIERRLEETLEPETVSETEKRDCLVEIRAGVGGDEASLFAADLYRMYTRFAEKQSWRAELISQSPSEVGGFKEIIFELSGSDVYYNLKFESGVHRVQRVPSTESQGRIHTSTSSVAVMPKASETEIEIKPSDLRIDTYRSSGHGGQSVNTTDSAVRITHLPSGIVVTCQDEKSQFKNKAKALEVLRARLWQQRADAEESAANLKRHQLIGKALRTEKIRTYNFPQDRLTDHRINFSLNKLPDILNGDLQALISKLQSELHKLDKQ